MKIFKRQKNKQKGFSLIESLLSITILMISIVVPLTMAWAGLLNAYLAEDQIVAFYLAQDAIEYVRNKRDYNKLSNTTSMLDTIFNNCKVSDTDGSGPNGIDNPGTSTEKGCNLTTFGPINNITDDKGIYNNAKLYYHSDGGEYDYTSSGGTLSKFSRQVRVGYINEGLSEAIIEVTIRWLDDTGSVQKYKLRTHLKDW